MLGRRIPPPLPPFRGPAWHMSVHSSYATLLHLHVVRNDDLEKTFMLRMGNGRRSKSRPRRRWMDEVVETTGLRFQQLKEAARDRVG